MKSENSRNEYQYTVYFEPAEEGGYIVTCPALPGLVTEGDTLEEAREMATDAIEHIREVVQMVVDELGQFSTLPIRS